MYLGFCKSFEFEGLFESFFFVGKCLVFIRGWKKSSDGRGESCGVGVGGKVRRGGYGVREGFWGMGDWVDGWREGVYDDCEEGCVVVGWVRCMEVSCGWRSVGYIVLLVYIVEYKCIYI